MTQKFVKLNNLLRQQIENDEDEILYSTSEPELALKLFTTSGFFVKLYLAFFCLTFSVAAALLIAYDFLDEATYQFAPNPHSFLSGIVPLTILVMIMLCIYGLFLLKKHNNTYKMTGVLLTNYHIIIHDSADDQLMKLPYQRISDVVLSKNWMDSLLDTGTVTFIPKTTNRDISTIAGYPITIHKLKNANKVQKLVKLLLQQKTKKWSG